MSTNSTLLKLVKPTVSGDSDVWGGYLNTTIDSLDTLSGPITTGGSANAYTLTTGQTLTAYADKQSFWIKASFANTGAATLNIDAIGAKNLRKLVQGTLTALSSGDINSGDYLRVVYNSGSDVIVIISSTNPTVSLDPTLQALAALAWSSGHPVIQFTAADTVSLTTTVTAGVGAAATPSYTFEGDPNTGMFWNQADELALTAGGTSMLRVATTYAYLTTGQFFAPDATVSAPAYSFVNSQGCGPYRIGSNNIGEAINGVKVFDWNASRLLMASAYDLQLATDVSAPVAASAGFRGTVIVAADANTTIAQSHFGKTLYHTSASTHTYTIDSNANLALPVGFMFKIVNENGGGNLTLAITTDTLRWGALTGSRTIPANSTAVLTKVASTLWRMEAGGNVS